MWYGWVVWVWRARNIWQSKRVWVYGVCRKMHPLRAREIRRERLGTMGLEWRWVFRLFTVSTVWENVPSLLSHPQLLRLKDVLQARQRARTVEKKLCHEDVRMWGWGGVGGGVAMTTTDIAACQPCFAGASRGEQWRKERSYGRKGETRVIFPSVCWSRVQNWLSGLEIRTNYEQY